MKKLILILLLSYFGCLIPGCRKITYTYRTIKSALVLFYSFNEHGIFPYTESYNKNELGIGVFADPETYKDELDIAQFSPNYSTLCAMENPHKIIWTNTIDSINVYTVYDFDENHPAGSKVNDILLCISSMGETSTCIINELSDISHYFKFSVTPTGDSLQFEIRGRITGEHSFDQKTDLVIIK